MLVSVIHRISDPDKFFQIVAGAGGNTPPDLKLPLSFTDKDRRTTVCLWEAPSVQRVRDFVEPLLAGTCDNEYAVVEPTLSSGLPATTTV